MTISLTFPDGAKREFPSGITGRCGSYRPWRRRGRSGCGSLRASETQPALTYGARIPE